MNNTSSQYPQRKNPRSEYIDYSAGDYFVTICTHHHATYFGYIEHDKMVFNPLGERVDQDLLHLSEHYPYAQVLSRVVMPNHVHFILHLEADDAPMHSGGIPLLSIVVGGLKRAVTAYAHAKGYSFSWQSRYYDHMIRTPEDANRIVDYIEGNVVNWALDRFYME